MIIYEDVIEKLINLYDDDWLRKEERVTILELRAKIFKMDEYLQYHRYIMFSII